MVGHLAGSQGTGVRFPMGPQNSMSIENPFLKKEQDLKVDRQRIEMEVRADIGDPIAQKGVTAMKEMNLLVASENGIEPNEDFARLFKQITQALNQPRFGKDS